MYLIRGEYDCARVFNRREDYQLKQLEGWTSILPDWTRASRLIFSGSGICMCNILHALPPETVPGWRAEAGKPVEAAPNAADTILVFDVRGSRPAGGVGRYSGSTFRSWLR